MDSTRLTERARQVMRHAKEEAQQMECGHASTEHILLGLINETDSVAVAALKHLGADLSLLRERMQSYIQNTSYEVVKGGNISLSTSGKQVLQFADQEGRILGVNFIATEHPLLGLIREGEGIAAKVLLDQGIDLDKARAEVLRLMGMGGGQTVEQPAHHSVMSPPCEAVIRKAKDTALRFGGPWALSEYLLLGLLNIQGTKALALLVQQGANLSGLREKTLVCVKKGCESSMENPSLRSPSGEGAIELGCEEAKNDGKPLMETEHLLLGLLRVGEGNAAKLLQAEGITLDKVRAGMASFEECTAPFFL